MRARFWAHEYYLFAKRLGWSKKDIDELETEEWLELRNLIMREIQEEKREMERMKRKSRIRGKYAR